MNAMMWVRGFAADYDEWAELAGPEWSFARLVEYFKRIERLEGAREAHEGADGRVHISRQRSPRRSTASRLEAVRQCGYSIDRPNKPEPRGFSETVVTQRRGARWSTADAYLRPALRPDSAFIPRNVSCANDVVKQSVGACQSSLHLDSRAPVTQAKN
jgi:choline dehydrogenase